MRRLTLLILLLCCWTLPPSAAGPTPGATGNAGHPRIGLVLSGGGARGAAHVGVLQVLEELRIPISVVVGTSMGALVGGTYATGMSPQEMERQLTGIDWNALFVDDTSRADWPIRRKEQSLLPTFDFSVGFNDGRLTMPEGALAGQKVEVFFGNLVRTAAGVRRFDELPIPFRAVATDLEDGSMKVFDSGALPTVMRASMSVPGVFAPAQIDDHLYVDGGLVRNLPVDVARRMGVDLVIAVNLGSTYLPRKDLNSVVGVLGQMVAILTQQNVEQSLRSLRPGRDLLISPDLGNISATDFTRAAEAIRTGVAAGRAAAPRLRHLSLSPDDWDAWRARRPRLEPDRAPIDEVEVRGLTWVNPALFAPLIAHQEGQPLDRARLDANISAIYAGGDFQNIDYQLERRLDRDRDRDRDRQRPRPGDPPGPAPVGSNLLDVHAREKSWGPGYLTFGLGLSSDFQGDTTLGLRGTYRRTWVNALGAEWYTTAQVGSPLDFYSEFYQPFTVARTAFIVPSVGYGISPLSIFDKDGLRIAHYDVTRSALALDLGLTLFDGNAELRVGAVLAGVQAKRDTGSPTLPEESSNQTGLRAGFVYDTLDSAYLPRHGQRLTLDLRSPQPAMGADQSFNRLEGRGTWAYSRGPNTLVGRALLGGTIGGDLPYYDQFPLGGFHQLSGYATDQFRANRVAFGSLTYFYRLANLTPPLGSAVYLGASLEVGDLQDTDTRLTDPGTKFGSSIFIGADTWIGPAYLGLGVAGDGATAGYLILGRP